MANRKQAIDFSGLTNTSCGKMHKYIKKDLVSKIDGALNATPHGIYVITFQNHSNKEDEGKDIEKAQRDAKKQTLLLHMG